MARLLWDASALVKRYASELGSNTVDTLFALPSPASMVTTNLSYAETCASLRRKRNGGVIDETTFTNARLLLRGSVFVQPGFLLLALDDEAILDSIPLADQHNLNSADAAVLFAYLRFQRALPSNDTDCLLVAADHHLLRAANTEGLRTLNPEQVTPTEVASLFPAP